MTQVLPPTALVTDPARLRRRVAALLSLARPRQWSKNVLVVAAPLAGARWTSDVWAEAAVAFLVFTVTAVGCYVLNDVQDVERDRLHEQKRHRPIASGEIRAGTARVVGIALILLGPAVALAARQPGLAAIVAVYAALTSAYSARLKEVAGLEMAVVASGFVLRPLAGAAATEVPPSRWFVLVVCAGAVMVVAGKRVAELAAAGVAHRPCLEAYTTPALLRVQAVAGGAMLGCYAGWVVTRPAHLLAPAAVSGAALALLTTRYLLCSRRGEGGAPERLLLSDRVLVLAGVVWLAAFLVGPGHG